MSDRKNKSGFTIIEMLVALAIVVAIVSMVYGSYAATTRAVDLYNAEMRHSARALLVVRLMARHIRGAYVPPPVPDSAESPGFGAGPSPAAGHRPDRPVLMRERAFASLFRGNPHDRRGEILSVVTTNAFALGPDSPRGLTHVTYHYDQVASTLSIGSQVCVDPMLRQREPRRVQPVLSHVTRIDLKFHDGRRWHDKWDYDDRKMMPKAVKVSLVVTDENGRQFQYATTTSVICQGPGGVKTAKRTPINEHS